MSLINNPKSSDSAEVEPAFQQDPIPPPDGGAEVWMTVARVFLVAFSAFGIGQTWGIFHSAYNSDINNPLYDVSPFKMVFIGGCTIGFGFLFGPFGNAVVGLFGVRVPISVGFLLMALGLMLASISRTYWELILSQGIMYGLGASLAYIPAIGLPSQWFTEHRGLATGIAATGSAIGALIAAPVAQAAIDNLSIAWALHVLGFIVLAAGATSMSLIQTRIHTQRVTEYNPFDLTSLSTTNFDLYLLFFLIGAFGYVIPLFTIPSYCITLGLSPANAASVLSVLCATNAIARIYQCPLRVRLPFWLMCILIWYFATSLGDMMAFAIFFGYFSGAYWSIAVPACMKVVGMPKLGLSTGHPVPDGCPSPIFAVPISGSIISDTARAMGITVTDHKAYRDLISTRFGEKV